MNFHLLKRHLPIMKFFDNRNLANLANDNPINSSRFAEFYFKFINISVKLTDHVKQYSQSSFLSTHKYFNYV